VAGGNGLNEESLRGQTRAEFVAKHGKQLVTIVARLAILQRSRMIAWAKGPQARGFKRPTALPSGAQGPVDHRRGWPQAPFR